MDPPPRPVLKWVGGKSQILAEVLSEFPRSMRSYHEPFLGGASVLLEVLHRRRMDALSIDGDIHASDVNPNLIGLYRNIQARPHELIAELESLANDFAGCPATAPENTPANRKPTSLTEAMSCRESYYYWARARYNLLSPEERLRPRGSALLVFLNRTCFRGVYREGPKGFNVPYGNYKNPGILDAENILRVSSLLDGVLLTTSSYEEALAPERLEAGDFVYLDPPYAPETATSFVGYTLQGFGPEDHDRLFALARGLAEQGIGMVMSNADVPRVRDVFNHQNLHLRTISCRRSIHSKKPATRTQELLIRAMPGAPPP